eukprot:scaffold1155_cov539-Pavlova_lutheri.AAC.1
MSRTIPRFLELANRTPGDKMFNVGFHVVPCKVTNSVSMCTCHAKVSWVMDHVQQFLPHRVIR